MSAPGDIISAGENDRGNIWVKTDPGADAPNQNTYEYYNQDNSKYSSKPDGSRDFHDGRGSSYHYPAAQPETAASDATQPADQTK